MGHLPALDFCIRDTTNFYSTAPVTVTSKVTMKFSVATLLLGLGAVNAVDLTPDNYDALTAGMLFIDGWVVNCGLLVIARPLLPRMTAPPRCSVFFVVIP